METNNNIAKRPKRFWTTSEVRFLKENYRKYNDKYLGEVLGRPASLIRNMRFRLGLTFSKRPFHGKYTPEENLLIRKHFALIPDDELAAMLGRSVGSVRTQACHLGLRKLEIRREHGVPLYNLRTYTPEALDFIKQNIGVLSAEELAEHLNKTPQAIRDRVFKMGLSFKEGRRCSSH